MSLTNLESVSDEEEQSNNGKKRVSYLYIREPGHEDNHQKYNEQAYKHIKSGGLIRNMMKDSEYGDVHGFASHIMAAVADILQDGDFSTMWEILEPQPEHLHEYLQDNPEIRKELVQLMKDEQNTGASKSTAQKSDETEA